MFIWLYDFFLFCSVRFRKEKDWEKMPKGRDHLKSNKLCSLTRCPKDALAYEGSFLVGLMAICIFMNCQA